MLITCETCPLNGVNLSDGRVLRAWVLLAEKPELRQVLTDEEHALYDSSEARHSEDEDTRKLANSRAIARCFVNKCITDECPIKQDKPTIPETV